MYQALIAHRTPDSNTGRKNIPIIDIICKTLQKVRTFCILFKNRWAYQNTWRFSLRSQTL